MSTRPSGADIHGCTLQVATANYVRRTGDIIHTVNRTPIESVEQLRSVVAQLKPRDPVVLRIERQGQLQYLTFEME